LCSAALVVRSRRPEPKFTLLAKLIEAAETEDRLSL